MFRVLLDAARKHPAIKKALVEVTSETEHDVIDLNAFVCMPVLANVYLWH